VIIANPFGPPAKGWEKAAETMDRAAANYRDGEAAGFVCLQPTHKSDSVGKTYVVLGERGLGRLGTQ